MTCTDKHKMRNSTSREQVFKHFLCHIGFFDYFCTQNLAQPSAQLDKDNEENRILHKPVVL